MYPDDLSKSNQRAHSLYDWQSNLHMMNTFFGQSAMFFFFGFFERLVILGDEQKDRSFWERDWHDQGREGGAHAQTYDLTLILAAATSIKIQQSDVSFPYIETSLLSYQIFQSLFEVFSRLVISHRNLVCAGYYINIVEDWRRVVLPQA